METIKSYTDISQSKQLAKILPLESADMFYAGHQSIINPKEWEYRDTPEIRHKYISFDNKRIFYPCWSLAVLLSVLPDKSVGNRYLTLYKEGKEEYCCCYEDANGNGFRHNFADNPIDACVEMILKLHELKML